MSTYHVDNNWHAIHSSGETVDSTSNTITLESGADGSFVGYTVLVIDGPYIVEERTIAAWNNTTKVATVDTNWSMQPAPTQPYLIAVGSERNSGVNEGPQSDGSGPFRTIQKAMDTMSAGDTAWVKGGRGYDDDGKGDGSCVFRLEVAGVDAAAPCQVRGYTSTKGDNGRVAIDATGKAYGLVKYIGATDQFWEIENFDFDGATGSGLELSGKNNIRLVNCGATGNGANGLYVGGSAVVEACDAADNTSSGIVVGADSRVIGPVCHGNGSTAGQMRIGADTVVEDCLIYDMVANQAGIYITTAPTPAMVKNCTVYGRDSNGDVLTGTIGIKANSTGSVHTLNCLFDCDVPVYAASSDYAMVMARNNLVCPIASASNYVNYLTKVGEVTTDDVGFIDPSSGDFGLRLGSLALGAGYPSGDIGAVQHVDNSAIGGPTNLGMQT